MLGAPLAMLRASISDLAQLSDAIFLKYLLKYFFFKYWQDPINRGRPAISAIRSHDFTMTWWFPRELYQQGCPISGFSDLRTYTQHVHNRDLSISALDSRYRKLFGRQTWYIHQHELCQPAEMSGKQPLIFRGWLSTFVWARLTWWTREKWWASTHNVQESQAMPQLLGRSHRFLLVNWSSPEFPCQEMDSWTLSLRKQVEFWISGTWMCIPS